MSEKSKWSYITKNLDGNIGSVLNYALGSLEKSNKSFSGVSRDFDFETNSGPNGFSRKAIIELISFFDEIDFSACNFEEGTSIGVCFEYILGVYDKSLGSKSCGTHTPDSVIELLVLLSDIDACNTVYDPCCGSARILTEASKYVDNDFQLYGQDISSLASSLAKINLHVSGLPRAKVFHGDTLKDPKALHDGELIKFDRILSNPPFSMKFRKQKLIESELCFDPPLFGFNGNSDFIFVQHMLASCKSDGRVVTTIPVKALYSSGVEKTIRKSIVNSDILESVILLPSGLFYGYRFSVAVIVLNKKKCDKRKNKILFVDASHDYEKDKYSQVLNGHQIGKIKSVFDDFESQGSYARLVTLDNIEASEYDLSVQCYVDNSPVLKRINELNKYHSGFEEYSFRTDHSNGVVTFIGSPSEKPLGNSIILSKVLNCKDRFFEHKEISRDKRSNYFEIQFDEKVVSSEYVKLFFEQGESMNTF